MENCQKRKFNLGEKESELTAGKASPSADRQNAPNNEMNNSKFGMATANKTGKNNYFN